MYVYIYIYICIFKYSVYCPKMSMNVEPPESYTETPSTCVEWLKTQLSGRTVDWLCRARRHRFSIYHIMLYYGIVWYTCYSIYILYYSILHIYIYVS